MQFANGKVKKMSIELNKEILDYIDSHFDETKELIKQLCLIPSPSHHEERRAAFIKKWLEDAGATGVYIDEAKNVVYPVNCEGRDDITFFIAHTDTVFPDMEAPMPFSEDDENLYSPGVGDDTTSLSIMLMAAKYVTQKGYKANSGIVFAANACEEGLGNLKGVKQLMKDYEGRVKELITFESNYFRVGNRCVGSHRYKILFETEGGHSFGAFGNNNAIHEMAKLVTKLYEKEVPKIEGTKTTYNVGIVSGGTSVNTIAQNCELMYEYRSDSKECLAHMKEFFEGEIEKAKATGKAKITVDLIGDRPCGGDVDPVKLKELTEKGMEISKRYSGGDCVTKSGSTDANIPQSLGIPAICMGLYLGKGSHTREEYVIKSSIPVGMRIAFDMILSYFG